MEDYRLNSLGLNEVCWTDTRKFNCEGMTNLLSGRQDGIHCDGMAIILDGSASRALLQLMPVSDLLMMARFVTLHAEVMFIQCYIPPNDHKDTEKECYCQELQELVSNIQWDDITIADTLPSAYGKCTDNGKCFINFCAMNNLKIWSSLFQHKDILEITWISYDHKTTIQIDHLAIGPIWRTLCLQDIKVHCIADIFIDHRLVTAKVEVKLKRHMENSQVSRHFYVSSLHKYPAM